MRPRVPKTIRPVLTWLAFALAFAAAFSIRTSTIVYGLAGDRVAQGEVTVRVGVLDLFHPREFVVQAPSGRALVLRAGERSMVLESSGVPSAAVKIQGAEVVVASATQGMRGQEIVIAGRGNEPTDFILEIPSKIRRRYHGTLEIKPAADSLVAIVTLDLETAVASVVAAESAPGTPPEALKASAIAARSYFVAGRGRHREFDFCDTTHCQFLRTPPPQNSPIAEAVEATRSLVLAYQSRPLAAMYTRSCSGHTRTPEQVGLRVAAYPYYQVECEYCRLHPVRWTSWISAKEAASLRVSDESSRLTIDHRLGWSAVPSSDFASRKQGDRVLLEGVGNGHGIGLCQTGAKAMAEARAGFREILEHYYPNADIVRYSASKRLGQSGPRMAALP